MKTYMYITQNSKESPVIEYDITEDEALDKILDAVHKCFSEAKQAIKRGEPVSVHIGDNVHTVAQAPKTKKTLYKPLIHQDATGRWIRNEE